MMPPHYRGRFAPSPSGPLHFGSLVAAVASYADARQQQGEWLVRIEDVDETRTRSGAIPDILQALECFGMHWDFEPQRQSGRTDLYDAALERLIRDHHAYRCNCSRKAIAALGRPGGEGPIYPGTCRVTPPAPGAEAAWRVIVPDQVMGFRDRILGDIGQNLASDIGDFVIRRIDGFTAYQLAVVVDDNEQGITDVVRGADLLWSTPRQIWLQQLLGYPTPRYAHIPLVYGPDGHKLSKRDHAHPVDQAHPARSLVAAWRHLGQAEPPAGLSRPKDFWSWAVPRWNTGLVPHDRNIRHERPDSL